MAKKKAPAEDSQNKKNQTDTGGSNESPVNPAITIRSGLLGIMLPAIAGSAAVVALCSVLLFFLLIQSGSQQQLAALGQNGAEQYLQDLEQQAQTFNSMAAALANSPANIKAVTGNAPEALALQAASLKALFPAATLVKLYVKGTAVKDAGTLPPVSFAQLDMLARAEKDNSSTPEIHIHGNQKFLTVAQAIKGRKGIVGSMLVSFDFAQIQPLLPTLANERGYVEVVQTFSNQPVVVFSTGNAQDKKGSGYTAKGAIGHFSAVFYPAPESDLFAASGALLWGVMGAALTLVTVFGLVSYMLLNKALQLNATALAAHFQAMISRSKPGKAFTLGIFASLDQTINRLFQDYEAKSRNALANTREKGKTAKTALPDFDPTFRNDDVLDLDIHADDHDLLSTAADHDDNPLLIEDNPDELDLDTVDMAEPQSVRVDVKIAPQIFRAYDIRGIVGQNLDADVAHAIGMAVGSEARDKGEKSVIIARDGRHSSQELAESLAEGIMATGVDIIDIGLVPTPVLYYATKTLRSRSGVVVTGSHNPPDYNGFKIVIADETLALDKIQALRKRLDEGRLHKGKGSYERQEVSQQYIDRINSDVVLAKPLKIVLDTGNGVAGPLAIKLLDGLGCAVTPLYTEIDGNFPNHHPDPSNPENLEDLIDNVQRNGADLGIALDGDGDRIGIVTPSGKIIWPDRLLMLCARDLLSRNPGADILYDVKCTRDVAELVSSLGGRAIMCATGHSLMKAKMKETSAVIGGELSGHIFFNDRWYGFDDALYTAARVLEILSMEPFDADEVFAEFPEKFSTPELHIKVAEANKFNIVKKLEEQGKFQGGNLVKIDGVRVDFPDSWGLIRASNTTPVLVARFEADTDAALEQVKTLFRDQLNAVEPGLSIPF